MQIYVNYLLKLWTYHFLQQSQGCSSLAIEFCPESEKCLTDIESFKSKAKTFPVLYIVDWRECSPAVDGRSRSVLTFVMCAQKCLNKILIPPMVCTLSLLSGQQYIMQQILVATAMKQRRPSCIFAFGGNFVLEGEGRPLKGVGPENHIKLAICSRKYSV